MPPSFAFPTLADSFPFEWIKKKWREAFHVTAMATSGTQWAVVMSRGAGYLDQVRWRGWHDYSCHLGHLKQLGLCGMCVAVAALGSNCSLHASLGGARAALGLHVV